MTEFEIEAIKLLRSIDARLKAVEEAAIRETSREAAKLAALPTIPPGLAAMQGILKK
jgi:hypothetical protein